MKNVYRVFLTAALLLLLAAFGNVALAAAGDAYTVKVEGTLFYSEAREVLNRVNEERALKGLGALSMDGELTEAAMQRAAECAVNFSHTRPDGTSGLRIHAKVAGENIAAGYSDAADVFQGWKESAGHYANMMGSSYQSIGIGCFQMGSLRYWVQLFSDQPAQTAPLAVDQKSAKKEVNILEKKSVKIGFNMNSYDQTSDFKLLCGSSVGLNVHRNNPDWSGRYCAFTSDSFFWSSSDPSVVSVDQNGTIVGRSAGSAVISARAVNGTAEAVSLTVRCKNSIEQATVSGISDVTYTGSAYTPDPVVSVQGRQLQKGSDYTVAWYDNQNAGTAVIRINGCGDYSGSIQKNFRILPADIGAKATIQVKNASAGLPNGYEALCKAVLVTWQGKTLVLDQDYYFMTTYYTKGGQATEFTLRFMHNYTGTRRIVLGNSGSGSTNTGSSGTGSTGSSTKAPANTLRIRLSKSAVSCTGKAQKPALTVYAGKKKLSAKNYKVSWKNNKNVGIATVAVRGVGKYKSYSGQATFRITLKKTGITSAKPAKNGKVTVKWKKVSGCQGYQIAVGKKKTFAGASYQTVSAKKTAATISGLKKGTTCYLRIRSYKKVGDTVWYSAWSSTKKVKVK